MDVYRINDDDVFDEQGELGLAAAACLLGVVTALRLAPRLGRPAGSRARRTPPSLLPRWYSR